MCVYAFPFGEVGGCVCDVFCFLIIDFLLVKPII